MTMGAEMQAPPDCVLPWGILAAEWVKARVFLFPTRWWISLVDGLGGRPVLRFLSRRILGDSFSGVGARSDFFGSSVSSGVALFSSGVTLGCPASPWALGGFGFLRFRGGLWVLAWEWAGVWGGKGLGLGLRARSGRGGVGRGTGRMFLAGLEEKLVASARPSSCACRRGGCRGGPCPKPARR